MYFCQLEATKVFTFHVFTKRMSTKKIILVGNCFLDVRSVISVIHNHWEKNKNKINKKPIVARILFTVQLVKNRYSYFLTFLTFIAIYCKSVTFGELQTSPFSHLLDENGFLFHIKRFQKPALSPEEVYKMEPRILLGS